MHSFWLSVRLIGANYVLLPVSPVWHGTWVHHVCSDFWVLHVREGSLPVRVMPLGRVGD